VAELDWESFKRAAIDLGRDRGAVVHDWSPTVRFVHPRADAVIEINHLDTFSVLIRTGWFLRHAVDFAPQHMFEIALADLAALFDTGATEYVVMRRGEAVAAGYELLQGQAGRSAGAWSHGRRYEHRVPAWGSL
jgi:hypothetical protein